MAGLKELRNRIEAIKSTKKITSAMKMVAAAGLRRAQGLIAKSDLYQNNLKTSALRLAFELKQEEAAKNIAFVYPQIFTGKKSCNTYLIVVISSDKGLCGSYNAHVAKAALNRIAQLKNDGKIVQVLCIGKKAAELIRRKYPDVISEVIDGVAKKGADFEETLVLTHRLLADFEKNVFDVAEIVSARFISALSRDIQSRPFIPAYLPLDNSEKNEFIPNRVDNAYYDYEPDKLIMLEALLIMLLKAQMFDAIVQAQASEQGARMASMDNATRNATDMISKLTLKYNGIRQSAITTELTEIISGAEAI